METKTKKESFGETKMKKVFNPEKELKRNTNQLKHHMNNMETSNRKVKMLLEEREIIKEAIKNGQNNRRKESK